MQLSNLGDLPGVPFLRPFLFRVVFEREVVLPSVGLRSFHPPTHPRIILVLSFCIPVPTVTQEARSHMYRVGGVAYGDISMLLPVTRSAPRERTTVILSLTREVQGGGEEEGGALQLRKVQVCVQ